MLKNILSYFTLPLLLLFLLGNSAGNAAPLRGIAPNVPALVPGPDVIVGGLPNLIQAGSSGTQVGLAMGTDTCNNGDVELNFFAMSNTDHPVMPQNLYRMSGGGANDERFEQIGQSWLKHAFFALQQNACGFGCTPASGGNHLGVGCSNPDSASLNANQLGLGSRAWVNPFTGAFPSTANSHTGHSHSATAHRLLVEVSDLDTTLNAGATYYAEAQLVTPHEYAWCQNNPGQCNMSNNVSYRQFSVAGTADFTFSPVGDTVTMNPAINAWTGATINPIEPEPGTDGRAFLAYKVTNPSAGVWHYEYAIYNENLDRAIQSFTVPLGCGIAASNLGFHAPRNHPGFANDGTVGDAGYSNAAWTSNQTASALSWSSETFAQNQNANAIRWGTLYNFRFDSNRPPQAANATIGFFKTGTPITVGIQGPAPDACTGATPTPSPAPTQTPPPLPPTPTPTPGQCVYVFLDEDFDGVTAPDLPGNWLTSFTPGPADCTPSGTCALGTHWTTSTTNPSSPPNCAFHDAPSCVTDSHLYSPSFFNATFDAVLIFNHNYDLPTGLDGAVLEISINDGPFIDFVAAGGLFNSGGYNGTISPGTHNPLAGRQAWTGTQGAFTVARMPNAAAGEAVRLRFRLATDCSGAGGGWRLDDIKVTFFAPCPSPTPSPTPTLPATHFEVVAPTGVPRNQWFPFTVRALDQFNNTATGYTGTIHFTSTSQASLPPDSTLTNGTGTFVATLHTKGNHTITATDTLNPSITGTSNNILVFADQVTPTPSPPPPTVTPPPTPTASPTPPTTPTPAPCAIISLNESFDTVTAPDLPAGWVSTFFEGSAGCIPAGICTLGTNWATSTDDPSSSPNCAFHDAPSCVTDSTLDTPPFPSYSGSILDFTHHYDVSSGFDGAVLEISIDGGPFIDFLAAGGTFFPGGGYNGTISNDFQNPLAGRAAWTGDSGGYITTFASMPPAANGSVPVILRFRLATDCGGSSSTGYRLDNIKVVFSIPCATPTPTVTPTPTPSPSPTPPTQALNLSTRMRVQTGDNAGIGGFIITGTGSKQVLFRGIGPSLVASGVTDALANPTLDLRDSNGVRILANNDWREDPAQEALIKATGIPPTDDLEAAIVQTLAPGSYTVILRGMDMTSGVGLVEIYDLTQGVDSKLANLSTRAYIDTGNNIVIAGFILGGSGNDRIVARGIGPSLSAFGVPNALPDPTLELRDDNGAVLIANNDWQDDPAQAVELTAAGLAPTNSLESGIAATLAPGLYTVLLAGANNGTGVGLVEVYDRGPP